MSAIPVFLAAAIVGGCVGWLGAQLMGWWDDRWER